MPLNVPVLRQAMEAAGLDAVVGTTYENVAYLSGFLSASLKLFPRDAQVYALVSRHHLERPVIIDGVGDMDALASLPGSFDTVAYGTFHRVVPEGTQLTPVEHKMVAWGDLSRSKAGPIEALAVAIQQRRLDGGVIGIDERAFVAGGFEKLSQIFPGTKFVPCSALLKEVRIHRTEDEIALIRQSARICENAIHKAVSAAREGMTEREMAYLWGAALLEQGAEPLIGFIRFGRNGAVSQVPAGDTPLRRGDLIWFDVCGDYRGYKSDIARTFALGHPGERALTYYNALKRGEEAMFEAARPGATAGQIFDACVEAVRKAGIPHYKRHHVGHSIGLEVYEPPVITPGNPMTVSAGTVLNVEAPYYEVGLGALHVEDPIVVREDGYELLTITSRDLVIL